MKFVGIGFLLALFYYSGVAQQVKQPAPTVTYRNPVIAGDFADPSVIRVGDTYYAAGTSSEWAPAYPIYSSKDLVNWAYVGPVFSSLPEWTMGSFWAPELFHRNGIFYVYYTARRKSDKRSFIGVATTRDLRKGLPITAFCSNGLPKPSTRLSLKTRENYSSPGKPTGWTKGRPSNCWGPNCRPMD
jgi:xylan 1,4-beta-xylosidase